MYNTRERVNSAVDPQKVYSVTEAAKLLGCTGESVRQRIKKNELLAARIGKGHWRISGDSLRKLYLPLEMLAPPIKIATQTEITKRSKAFFERAKKR